jgi:hypothetical protein
MSSIDLKDSETWKVHRGKSWEGGNEREAPENGV